MSVTIYNIAMLVINALCISVCDT